MVAEFIHDDLGLDWALGLGLGLGLIMLETWFLVGRLLVVVDEVDEVEEVDDIGDELWRRGGF